MNKTERKIRKFWQGVWFWNEKAKRNKFTRLLTFFLLFFSIGSLVKRWRKKSIRKKKNQRRWIFTQIENLSLSPFLDETNSVLSKCLAHHIPSFRKCIDIKEERKRRKKPILILQFLLPLLFAGRLKRMMRTINVSRMRRQSERDRKKKKANNFISLSFYSSPLLYFFQHLLNIRNPYSFLFSDEGVQIAKHKIYMKKEKNISLLFFSFLFSFFSIQSKPLLCMPPEHPDLWFCHCYELRFRFMREKKEEKKDSIQVYSHFSTHWIFVLIFVCLYFHSIQ